MGQNDLAEKKAQLKFERREFADVITVLMHAYGDQIFRFCLSSLRNEHDAQDVLQVTFIQAYEALDKFSEQSSFRTWLYSIAHHRCLDRKKVDGRLRQRIEFTDELPEQESADVITDEGFSHILKACLEGLSTKVKSAVVLRFQSELSFTELAEVLQEKSGTLQARVARALPVLRRCLEEQGVEL